MWELRQVAPWPRRVPVTGLQRGRWSAKPLVRVTLRVLAVELPRGCQLPQLQAQTMGLLRGRLSSPSAPFPSFL